MNKALFGIAIGGLVLSTSCVQSLYPLAQNDNQVIFKSELLGKWKENDGTEYLVDSLRGKVYKVTIVDHGKAGSLEKKFCDTSHFLMSLVNVRGEYFLDCFPDTGHRTFYQLGEQTVNFLLPVHFILKLNSIAHDSIEIATISDKEMLKLIDQKKFRVGYHKVGADQVLLSQKPEQLQKKLTKLETFPSAFETSIFWRH